MKPGKYIAVFLLLFSFSGFSADLVKAWKQRHYENVVAVYEGQTQICVPIGGSQ